MLILCLHFFKENQGPLPDQVREVLTITVNSFASMLFISIHILRLSRQVQEVLPILSTVFSSMHSMSVLWDLLQQRGPPKLCDKVPRTAAQRCDYSLRNSSSPAIPLCRTFHRQNSFLPASLALFNSLPASNNVLLFQTCFPVSS